MKTKFWHVKQPNRLRCTVAVDVIDKPKLVDLGRTLLESGFSASYEGNLGIARVNPKDKWFVKATGREISVKNAVKTVYWLQAVYRENEGTVYKFYAVPQTENGVHPEQGPIEINLYTKPGSTVVHVSFVNAVQIKRI